MWAKIIEKESKHKWEENQQLQQKDFEQNNETEFSIAGVGKVHLVDQTQPNTYFNIGHELRMVFTLSNIWEKIKRKIIFRDIWNWNFSVQIVLLEHNHAHIFTYCLWLLSQ